MVHDFHHDELISIYLIYPNVKETSFMSNIREESLKKHYEPLIKGINDMKRAFAIIKDTVFKAVVLSNDYCPYTLDPLTCHTIGRGECTQRCIVLVSVLRSLGIPAAIDCLPMWSDYSNKGHAWVSIVAKNGETYTVYEQDTIAKIYNPIDASQFIPRYKIKPEDHCPYSVKTSKTPIKVYRNCFERYNDDREVNTDMLSSPFFRDVSKHYGLHSNIVVNVGECNSTTYLCCYSSGTDWIPVAKAKPKNGLTQFQNVGKGAVCVVTTIKNGKNVFLSKPFIVGEQGIERYFDPSEKEESITINRKYPLCSYITDTWGYMRGGTFEGSMTKDFQIVDTIATITSMPFGMTTIEISRTNRYRYLRYHAPNRNRSSLAEIQFYTTDTTGNRKLLKGSTFGEGVDSMTLNKAFDGNISTICRGLQVGYFIGIDLGIGKESTVRTIKFCPSSDLNFVERNHLYELYYFDNEWHLIGRTYSGSETLTFDKVPKGSLLLLKDKSAGKEERIFEYVDGEQLWH